MACKGICVRHRAPKPILSGRYISGQKRCQLCEEFIIWDMIWCPCCGSRLRTKPRNSAYKEKFAIRTRRQLQTRTRKNEQEIARTIVRY